jgi:hypothetical protein
VEESFSSCTSRKVVALDLWIARGLIESGAMLIALPACSRQGTILKIGIITFSLQGELEIKVKQVA